MTGPKEPPLPLFSICFDRISDFGRFKSIWIDLNWFGSKFDLKTWKFRSFCFLSHTSASPVSPPSNPWESAFLFPLAVRSTLHSYTATQLHSFTLLLLPLLLLLLQLQPEPGFTRDPPIWIDPARGSRRPPSWTLKSQQSLLNIASHTYPSLVWRFQFAMGSTQFGNFHVSADRTWRLNLQADTDRKPVWVPQDFCRDSTLPVCNVSEIFLKPPYNGLEFLTDCIICGLQLFTNQTATDAFGACDLTGIPLSGDRHLRNLGTIYEARGWCHWDQIMRGSLLISDRLDSTGLHRHYLDRGYDMEIG